MKNVCDNSIPHTLLYILHLVEDSFVLQSSKLLYCLYILFICFNHNFMMNFYDIFIMKPFLTGRTNLSYRLLQTYYYI